MEGQGDKTREGPHWITKFLSIADDKDDPKKCYFSECDCRHPSRKQFFCVTCEEGPLCCHKMTSEHMKQQEHKVLQTRKSSRRTAILKKDIEQLINVEDVQIYTINNDWVVYLNRPAENEKKAFNGSSSASCLGCGRGLVKDRSDGYCFCCISCKKSCLARDQSSDITLAPPAAVSPPRANGIQLLTRKRFFGCARRTPATNLSPLKKRTITQADYQMMKAEARALTFFTDLDLVREHVTDAGSSSSKLVRPPPSLKNMQINCEDDKLVQMSLQTFNWNDQSQQTPSTMSLNQNSGQDSAVTAAHCELEDEEYSKGVLRLFF